MFWLSDIFCQKVSAVELVLKSVLGRNNSLEPPVFGFSSSLPYDLKKSRELRALIIWVLG